MDVLVDNASKAKPVDFSAALRREEEAAEKDESVARRPAERKRGGASAPNLAHLENESGQERIS